jgi:hypothetical protein
MIARYPGGREPVEQLGERAVLETLRRALVEHLRGVVLRLLDVGLVERVDPQRPAGHRGGELGEEEDPSEVVHAAGGDGDRRVAAAA